MIMTNEEKKKLAELYLKEKVKCRLVERRPSGKQSHFTGWITNVSGDYLTFVEENNKEIYSLIDFIEDLFPVTREER